MTSSLAHRVARLGIRIVVVALAACAWAETPNVSIEGGAARDRVFREERIDAGQSASLGYHRQVILVPPEYGKLVAVTQGRKSVLWYEAEDGTLRNVLVDGDQLLAVRRSGRLVSEVR